MLPVIYVPRDTPSVDPPGVLGVALTTILREDGYVQINQKTLRQSFLLLHAKTMNHDVLSQFDHHLFFCSVQKTMNLLLRARLVSSSLRARATIYFAKREDCCFLLCSVQELQ